MGPGLVSLSKMSGAERKAEAKTMQGTSGLRVVFVSITQVFISKCFEIYDPVVEVAVSGKKIIVFFFY